MKWIKKLLITVIFIVFSINYSFAQSLIELKSNWTDFDINDPIRLEINISLDGYSNIKIWDIKGLDNFDIVWKSQSQSYRNINGRSSIQISQIYTIKAIKKWVYTLWPVIAYEWNKKLESNTIEIKVSGERIFLGNSNNISTTNNTPPITTKNNNNKTISEKEDTNNTDIRNIKGDLPISFLEYYKYILIFIIFAGIGLLYLFFSIDNKQEEKTLVSTPKKEKIIESNINYSKWLEDIEKYYIEKSKEKFYTEIGSFFKKYIKESKHINLDNKTFQESQNELDPTLKEIWKNIYYPEYNTHKDSLIERKNLINQLKKLISNTKNQN